MPINKSNYKIFIEHFFRFFLVIFLILNLKGLSCVDFFYTFGFANDIHNGLTPYVDFNMVISPLFAWIMAPFAGNTTIFNIFGSIFMASLFAFIMTHIEQHKVWVWFILVIKVFGLVFFEYNIAMISTLIISFIFLLEYLENHDQRNIFFTALLLSISLLMKHSVPAIVIILLTPIILVDCMKRKKYEDFGAYAVGGIIPVAIVCLIAIIGGFWYDMLDITLLGISDFVTFNNFHPTFALVAVLFAFALIVFVVNAIKTKSLKSIVTIVYLLGIPVMVIMQDLFHNIYGMLYILSIYAIAIRHSNWVYVPNEDWMFSKPNKNQIFYWASSIFIAFCTLTMSIPYAQDFSNQMQEEKYELNSNILRGNDYNQVIYELVTETDKYMKEHDSEKIVVVSEISKVISLYQNNHHGPLDLIVKGNGGPNETTRVIDALHKYDKVIVIPYNSFAVNEEIYEYIEENFEVCDTLTMFNTEYKVYEVGER